MKHLVELTGLVMIGVLSVVSLMGADGVVNVTCGQDLDATINADDPTIGTRFQLEGPCTYTVDAPVALNDGDEIAGPVGTFVERGVAFDPQPTVDIVGNASVSKVIRAEGAVHLEWVKIVGGTGQYSEDGSPVAGTGSGLAMGKASNTSSLYAVHVTGSDAVGISNARGTFDRIELDDTTQDPNFLGFTGAGLKAINEVEVRNSYVHDNQGNGLWCDEGCNDSASHPNGFWIHDNLIVDNGQAGVRYERSPVVEDGVYLSSPNALIENNEVHGNSSDAVRGGVSIADAQNALVRNNVFGEKTIADVAYPPNRDPNGNNVAIRATDSGRSDRPDLWNVDIVENVLNSEAIKGCQSPDEIVYCSDSTPPSVTSTVPIADVKDVSSTVNVAATFSEDMDTSSITAATFKLFKKGSTTKIAATLSYDAATDTATLDPANSLKSGATYEAVVTTGAKDLAGNPLDQNSTETGSQVMAWSFTVSK